MTFQKVLFAAGVAGALLGVVPHASAGLEVIVHLDQLVCVRGESEPGGAEPYAWTALVTGTVDRVTAVVGDIKVVAPAVPIGDRAVIKKGMRAGQRANMPAAQRRLVQYFGDNEVGFAAIVVVLLEDDGMPESATRAGYRKFREALKTEVTKGIKANNGRLPDMLDSQKLRRAIEPKVRRAAKNALSGTEKLLIFFGFKGVDDNIGFDFASTRVALPETTPFMEETPEGISVPSPLSFEHEVTIPATVLHPSGSPPIVVTPERKIIVSYRLEGRFEVRRAAAPPPPPPPPPPRPRPPGTHEE